MIKLFHGWVLHIKAVNILMYWSKSLRIFLDYSRLQEINILYGTLFMVNDFFLLVLN